MRLRRSSITSEHDQNPESERLLTSLETTVKVLFREEDAYSFCKDSPVESPLPEFLAGCQPWERYGDAFKKKTGFEEVDCMGAREAYEQTWARNCQEIM
jgi:hypothetical protein